jgi:uncharacterized membrane protein
MMQAALTYSFSTTLHYSLKTSGLDGTTFEQILWNVVGGNGLVTTLPPPYIKQNWLGFHFSPILYAVAPIYCLFPNIKTLLFLHSFLIAIAAIPIFFAAKILLKSQWQALTISIFYLINPFVINAQIWDFHEIAFAPLIISLILLSVIRKKRAWLIFFCAILLTIKEHYGLAVFGIGILWAYHWRDYKLGLALATFGLIAFITVIKIIMPHFSTIGGAAMLSENSEINFFSWVTHPLADIDLLKRRIFDAIFYGILLLFSLWFQPIFSIAWLFPALADGAINALSNNDMLRHPSSYHSAAIIPVLLIAYTRTISKRYNNTTRLKRWEVIGVTSLMVGLFTYSFTSLPKLPNNFWELSAPRFSLTKEDEAARNDVLKIIGETSSVSAQSNILPHIPVREQIYMFPHGIENSEYIIIKTAIPFAKKSNVFGVPYFSKYTDKYFFAAFQIINDKNWGIVYYQNNWLLLKRGGKNNQDLQKLAEKDLQELRLKVENMDKRKIVIQP